MIRAAINSQRWLSRKFDRLLPAKFKVDGNMDFRQSMAPDRILKNCRIYDIGSGRHPFLTLSRKLELGATVTGLDIDKSELAAAPKGAYDRAICCDITSFVGQGDADVVICQSVLEHVAGVEKAFSSISGILKPGGIALTFVPSRHALFARLNLLLPQRTKEWLLFKIYPETVVGYGFPAFYDRCTPGEFKSLAESFGLEVLETRCYYKSTYFSFFFPAHVLYRLWNMAAAAVAGEQGAETFAMAFRKPERLRD